MDVTPEWLVVGSFSNGLEADMARQALEAAEIPVLVRGDRAGIFGAAFQGTVAGGIDLVVPAVLLEEAREILAGDS